MRLRHEREQMEEDLSAKKAELEDAKASGVIIFYLFLCVMS